MRSPPKTSRLRRGRSEVSNLCFFTSFHIELFLKCGHASKVISCLTFPLKTFQWLSSKCKQSLWDVSYDALFTQLGPNLPSYISFSLNRRLQSLVFLPFCVYSVPSHLEVFAIFCSLCVYLLSLDSHVICFSQSLQRS